MLWAVFLAARRQAQHFDLVFGAARKAGWVDSPGARPVQISHVGFGLVLGEDGKKLKWVLPATAGWFTVKGAPYYVLWCSGCACWGRLQCFRLFGGFASTIQCPHVAMKVSKALELTSLSFSQPPVLVCFVSKQMELLSTSECKHL